MPPVLVRYRGRADLDRNPGDVSKEQHLTRPNSEEPRKLLYHFTKDRVPESSVYLPCTDVASRRLVWFQNRNIYISFLV
jgi:hypothetical protein